MAGRRLFGAAAGIMGTFFEIGLGAGQALPGLLLSSFAFGRLLKEQAPLGASPTGPPTALP